MHISPRLFFQIYVSETCEPSIRSKMNSVMNLFSCLGYLFIFVIGGFFHWKIVCFILAAPPLILVVLLYLIPETPYWVLMKQRDDEALEILKKFRNKSTDLKAEYSGMKERLREVSDKVGYKEFLKTRSRIPLLIGIFCTLAQQISGSLYFLIYTSKILKDAGSTVPESISMIIVGVSQAVASIWDCFYGSKYSKKIMFTVSLLGMGLSSVSLAVHFYLPESYQLGWIPITTIGFAVAFFSIGVRSIPYVILAEVFNTKIRSTGTSIVITFNEIFCVLAAEVSYILMSFASFTLNYLFQSFPYAVKYFGNTVVFGYSALFFITFGLISPKVVPNTNDKSLEELQEKFQNKSKKSKEENNTRL